MPFLMVQQAQIQVAGAARVIGKVLHNLCHAQAGHEQTTIGSGAKPHAQKAHNLCLHSCHKCINGHRAVKIRESTSRGLTIAAKQLKPAKSGSRLLAHKTEQGLAACRLAGLDCAITSTANT
jgi:hypothetical protein